MSDTSNGNQVATTATRPPSAVTVFQHDIDKMAGQFDAALPRHIPVERFVRVVQTAVMGNPDLLKADRKSLWQAAMKAAQDGLLPDGREAALIARKGRVKVNGQWQDSLQVSYQPMIAGVRKKARNSGEISTWDAHIVCEGDDFVFQLGDDPRIEHSYNLKTERGKMIGAYSVCTLKDGTKSYEVMSLAEIYAIRNRSDAWKAFAGGLIKSTPWSTDEGEMARKTVAKRHSKVLPMSTDLDDLMRRDDDLYDFKKETDEDREATRVTAAPKPRTLAGKLDAIAGGTGRDPAPQVEEGFDPETGEEIEGETPAEAVNRQPEQGQAAGDDGKGAGQPATAKPAAATKPRATKAKPAAAPEPKEEGAPPVADEPANDDQPQEDEGNPAAPAGEEDGPGKPGDDVDVLSPEVLTAYHAELMRAMSPGKLDQFHNAFVENMEPGDAMQKAMTRIYEAHYSRITEDHPASSSDALLKRILAGG